MKKIFTYFLVAAFFLTGLQQAQAQIEKTIVKTLAVDNVEGVVLNMPAQVEMEKWDEDYMRILVTVEATNVSEPILERLVAAGRYSIQANEMDNELLIQMPKMEHQVMIKGVNLNDNLKVVVYYPEKKTIRIQKPDYYRPDPAL